MINLVFFLTGLSVLGAVLRYLWICDTPDAGRAAVQPRNSVRRAAAGFDSGAGAFGSRPADGRDERRIWPEAVCSAGALAGFFDMPDTGAFGHSAGPQILDAAAFEPAACPAGGISAGDLAGDLRSVVWAAAAAEPAVEPAVEPASDRLPACPADAGRRFFTAA